MDTSKVELSRDRHRLWPILSPMNFLQTSMLAALPAAALPIIIHLINRYRHRTMPWAAMMFLIDAKRMTHGMARLRHILILAMRVLAIAGLVFAVSRPLASGLLGQTVGGAADTTIILLDRSASMEHENLQSRRSKREAALQKVSELLETVGANTRIVLIDNTTLRPEEIDSPSMLLSHPLTTPTSTSSDIPAMVQAAADYMQTNETGRTDVWLCSDLQSHDWSPDDGRWDLIRQQLSQRDGTRLYLLTYPETDDANLSVSVSRVHRRQFGGEAELLLDITVRQPTDASRKVPIQLVINGARTEIVADIQDREHIIQGHSVAIDSELARGWGRVELPSDSNQQDNVYHFVFSEPPIFRTTIVTDDAETGDMFRLAAETPMDRSITHEVNVLSSRQVQEVSWDETALLVWQAALPTGLAAKQLDAFVDAGKSVIFLPPTNNGTPVPAIEPGTSSESSDLLGEVAWGEWRQVPDSGSLKVTDWRNQSDILGRTEGGTSLPLGKLRVFRHRELHGSGVTDLARLEDGNLLMARVPTQNGSAYFCTTLPQQTHSTFARDGVAFYVMIQRSLAAGAAALGDSKQLEAGLHEAGQFGNSDAWSVLDQSAEVLSNQRRLNSGAYESEGKLVAINRQLDEDDFVPVTETSLGQMLAGVDFQHFTDRAADSSPLANEIWRAFLIAMVLFLLAEAMLCLPRKTA